MNTSRAGTGASLASILLALFLALPAAADFERIELPDADYQEATSKIDLCRIADGTRLSAITDGTLTVTFRPGPDADPDGDWRLEKLSVDCCWATWSSPPQSEDASPDILSNENLSLIMDLNIPVTTFGFELEPNVLSPARFTVDFLFLNGEDETVVGTIELDVLNRFGARLFAASAVDEIPFNRIVIRGEDYFALAQIRYDFDAECLDVNIDIEPGNDHNVIKLAENKSIRVAILSTADLFDATTVDPSSVCFGQAWDPRGKGDCTTRGPAQIQDVNADYLPDLVLRFDALETGIQPGDPGACLVGRTFGGTGGTFGGVCITGCDEVQTKVK